MSEKKYSAYLIAMTTALSRLFRCLLAYVNYRLHRIKDNYWENGGNVSEDSQMFMSANEKAFYLGYKKAIFDYEDSFPIDIDLYKDLEPPRYLFIQILVLEDCGELMTSNGDRLNLKKGVTLSVRRGDVEHLMLQNLVVQTG